MATWCLKPQADLAFLLRLHFNEDLEGKFFERTHFVLPFLVFNLPPVLGDVGVLFLFSEEEGIGTE